MKKVLIAVILMVGVLAGVWLVKRNQEIGKGAAIADSSSQILPSTNTVNSNQNFEVDVWLNTGTTNDKLVGAEFKVSYDPTKVAYVSSSAQNGYTILNDAVDDGNGTLSFKMVTLGTEIGGAVDIVKISLRSLGGSSTMKVFEGKLMVNGQSATWDVATNNSSNIVNTTVNNTVAPTVFVSLTPTMTPKLTLTPTITPRLTPTSVPTATPSIVSTIAPTMTVIPTAENPSEGVLIFQVTSEGATSLAACANNWKADVTVIGGGKSMSYRNVALAASGEIRGLKVFRGEVVLKGLGVKNGLAVFVKGEKHLQVKYGVNGQNKFFNQPGGQINVTADRGTTPVLDFTNYPMTVGDVFGENSKPDGLIDGRDFSFVKTEVDKRSQGNDLVADLNGNCSLESQDLALLMLAMKDKQEQLY